MNAKPRTMTAAQEEYFRCHGPIAVLAELDAERRVSAALAEAVNKSHFALCQAITRAERNSFDGGCPENWLDAEVTMRAALAQYNATQSASSAKEESNG